MNRAIPLTLALAAACSAPAFAWGQKGHLIVSGVGASELRGRVPGFMTAASAEFELRYLGPEEDRLKDSGASWNADDDPGHYLDVRDDGTIAGVVQLADLPANREAYDAALRAAGTDQYRQGFLPYEILDGWERLRTDFAFWRADAANPRLRAIDEQLAVRDAGDWSHFVGDGSQPLHVTVHFNGWGDYPNPGGFTQSHDTHAFFESTFVNRYVSETAVAALAQGVPLFTPPSGPLSERTVLHEIERYLISSERAVPELYRIDKAGGFDTGSASAASFVDERLAAGAAEFRNLTIWAWQDSGSVRL